MRHLNKTSCHMFKMANFFKILWWCHMTHIVRVNVAKRIKKFWFFFQLKILDIYLSLFQVPSLYKRLTLQNFENNWHYTWIMYTTFLPNLAFHSLQECLFYELIPTTFKNIWHRKCCKTCWQLKSETLST